MRTTLGRLTDGQGGYVRAAGLPARVVIAAVAWIIIGLVGAQLALVYLSIWRAGGVDAFGTGLTVISVIISAPTAILGIAGGIGLLRARRWSRAVLEALTWVYCVIALAASLFGVYSFATWSDPTSRWVPVISLIGYPIAFVGFLGLLWVLRSRETRDTVANAAQQAHRAGAASPRLP